MSFIRLCVGQYMDPDFHWDEQVEEIMALRMHCRSFAVWLNVMLSNKKTLTPCNNEFRKSLDIVNDYISSSYNTLFWAIRMFINYLKNPSQSQGIMLCFNDFIGHRDYRDGAIGIPLQLILSLLPRWYRGDALRHFFVNIVLQPCEEWNTSCNRKIHVRDADGNTKVSDVNYIMVVISKSNNWEFASKTQLTKPLNFRRVSMCLELPNGQIKEMCSSFCKKKKKVTLHAYGHEVFINHAHKSRSLFKYESGYLLWHYRSKIHTELLHVFSIKLTSKILYLHEL